MRIERLSDSLVRLLAPNPGPLTGEGTNTYLVGDSRGCAVIDPGPDDPRHLAALLDALGRRPLTAILVTHAHLDHSALAPALSAATGAPALAAGGATEGRSAAMEALAASGLAGGGEGIDAGFVPDRRLAPGEVIDGPGWSLEAIPTPGHLPSHLAFALGDIIFTGDHVMGWSTTIVSPPDGDMGAYMASLERLSARPSRRFLPGHGAPVEDPAARLAELVAHRRAREGAILARLRSTPRSAAALASEIYTDTPAQLLPAATRNVLAHLLDLHERGLVRPDGPLAHDTGFSRT